MTKRTDAELFALYGVCHLCGAPMNSRMFQRDNRAWSTMYCIAEPLEHRYDIHLLDEWERGVLADLALIEGRA